MKGSDKLGKTSREPSQTTQQARPMITREAREMQLISLAEDRAEEQLRNGTASSQVITHFLKLGCLRAQLENEKLKAENQLLEAKTEMIKAAKTSEELYSKALAAMRDYSGKADINDED